MKHFEHADRQKPLATETNIYLNLSRVNESKKCVHAITFSAELKRIQF